VYYHDPQYQRQRQQERMAEMRKDYRRAQPAPRDESQPRERMSMYMRSMWRWMRRHSTRRAPAYWA
jgi:hypothetical protein